MFKFTVCHALVLLALIEPKMSAQEAIRNGEPFALSVTKVRSVAPEERVGFSKSLAVYAVEAHGPSMSYVVYCTKAAPQVGQSYTALDEYVAANYSWLHLWPVERATLQMESGAKTKKKGRLYRVIIIQNVLPEPHPDLACDIHSEKAIEP